MFNVNGIKLMYFSQMKPANFAMMRLTFFQVHRHSSLPEMAALKSGDCKCLDVTLRKVTRHSLWR